MAAMAGIDDRDAVAAQLGRPLRAASRVAHRCALGLPVVVEVPPFLDTGEPFPTRYWLSCPLAHRRVARIEGRGGVREATRRTQEDPAFAQALEAAHARYAAERDALVGAVEGPRPSGGVGGTAGGVKCLHAHYADLLAGNDNPVAEAIRTEVGALDCEVPCVIEVDGSPRRNPAWREPKP
jgi:hypothetical protein